MAMSGPKPPHPLAEKLPSVPLRPGVYMMKDAKGRFIYVGKAKALRKRLQQYFGTTRPNERIIVDIMVDKARDFETIVTDSEVEALILEATLVKEHKPRYNIHLKDDKKYPYIEITDEPFPRVTITRRPSRDSGRTFGPYTDVKSMRRTLETLRRVFPIRSCRPPLPAKSIDRPCLDYHIKRCEAPCVGYVSQEGYNRMIDQAALFLSGRSRELVHTLDARMHDAAEEEHFEEAAVLRDRLQDVHAVLHKQRVVTLSEDDWDVVGLYQEDDSACGVVLEVRGGKLLGRKHHFLSGVLSSEPDEVVRSFVTQFYVGAMRPPGEIVLPCEVPDAELVEHWLSEMRGRPVHLRAPKRGIKARMGSLAARNAESLFIEWKFKRERRRDRVPHLARAVARDLHLAEPVRRVSCVDISTIQGADAVGSLVTFVDGKPRKSEYRHFRIRTVAGQDDFAMLREVVVRHYTRLTENGAEPPDLLLVDGGVGQLRAVESALEAAGHPDQAVAALAKRLEEVFLPDHLRSADHS